MGRFSCCSHFLMEETDSGAGRGGGGDLMCLNGTCLACSAPQCCAHLPRHSLPVFKFFILSVPFIVLASPECH